MTLGFIRFLVRHRWTALIFLATSVGVAAYAARNTQVRFQFRDFYEYPTNPRLPLFERYTAEFGDPAGYVVLLVEAPDVFQPEVLRYVSDLTRLLEPISELSEVKSLTNVRSIRAEGEDVESGPIMKRLPATPKEVEDLRRTALQSAMVVRRVVSVDSTATAVLAEMRIPAASATVEQQGTAVKAVERVVSSHPPPPGVRLQITGSPVVEVETTRSLIESQLTLTPVVVLVIVLALALTFRSVQGVLLPLAAVIVSVVWTAGIYSLFKRPLDIIGSTFPTMLLVYGVVDPIFVYTRYRSKIELGLGRTDGLISALAELLLPCFLTSLTTALGFAAFVTATLPTLRDFGLIMGIGVSLSFVTTVTVLPVLVAVVRPPKRQRSSSRVARRVEAGFVWLWSRIRPRRAVVLAGALALIAAGAGAGWTLQIVNVHVGNLPSGPVRDSVRVLEQKLSGVIRFIVYLEGPAGSMKRPEVMRAIDAVDKFAETQSMVNSSISLADLVADANQAFEGGNPAEHRVPESASLIAQYLALLDASDRADFVSDDYSKSHIRMLVMDRGSLAMRDLREALDREIARELTPLGVNASLTGNGVVLYVEADRIVAELLWGFVAAFAIIVALEWAVFRSLRVALISIVPNLVPVAACFTTMRLLGLHLRVDSSLVMCVSVGGLFNTTIHVIARILRQIEEGATDPDLIIERSLRTVGPPSLYTAAILSAGFAVLTLAPFPGLKVLGLLTMVTLLTGFVSDAVVTPTLMRAVFDWKRAIAAARHASEGSNEVGPVPMLVDAEENR